MTALTKINGFAEHLPEGVHNLGSNQLIIELSNTDPTTDGVQASTAAAVLATVTVISYTNLSSRILTTSSSAQTSGTYALVLNDLVLSATGTVADFRYVYVVDNTATNKDLIGYYDNGSVVSMTTGETYTIDFTGNFITLS
jgi:hypothetical protein